MRSKAPLALMEQLVMTLVFALAAALCVQAFAVSSRLSNAGAERDQAILLAQSAAEIAKTFRGDGLRVAQTLNGAWSESADEAGDGSCFVFYDEDLQPVSGTEAYAYQLVIDLDSSGAYLDADEKVSGLGNAVVFVYNTDREVVAELRTAWQEVEGDG